MYAYRDTNRDSGYTESQQKSSTLSVQTLATTIVLSNTQVSPDVFRNHHLLHFQQVRAWPGERFSINVGGEDEFGHPTTVAAKFSFQVM